LLAAAHAEANSGGEAPFDDRRLREPLELTSRVSTDKVAEAKDGWPWHVRTPKA
jgi:hypothetical protein